jgi:hypothetical protein
VSRVPDASVGFLPGFLGVLVIISGLSYLTNSFALFLSPKLAGLIFPVFVISAGVPEMILTLWLIVAGLNESKWQEKAARFYAVTEHA